MACHAWLSLGDPLGGVWGPCWDKVGRVTKIMRTEVQTFVGLGWWVVDFAWTFSRALLILLVRDSRGHAILLGVLPFCSRLACLIMALPRENVRDSRG